MIYIFKEVQQEHILPPIRAEPVMGKNSLSHKDNHTKIKKKG